MNKEQAERSHHAARHLSELIPYLPIEPLVDLAMIGNEPCHAALARAAQLAAPVSAALAEMGEEEALTLLLRNSTAMIAPFSLIRIVERFSGSEPLLCSIEARQEANEDVWAALAAARLRAIFEMMGDTQDASAIDQAIIALLWASDASVRASYIASFLRFDRITPQLIRLSLSSGATEVAAAILAVLSDVSIIDIEAMLNRKDRRAFARLLDIVGLPSAMVPEFEAALARSSMKPSDLSKQAA
jgi:hypothetical protein